MHSVTIGAQKIPTRKFEIRIAVAPRNCQTTVSTECIEADVAHEYV
jgi:hypothetical protein